METYEANNVHGRKSLPGAYDIISDKRAKQLQRNIALAPKAKNGITDPFTYYHIVDELLSTRPGNLFTAREFTQALGKRPLTFDPITVGRVLGDIAESLRDAYGIEVIHQLRSTDGRRYWTEFEFNQWLALERLLEDLERLCLAPAPDARSPLYRCPSVGVIA